MCQFTWTCTCTCMYSYGIKKKVSMSLLSCMSLIAVSHYTCILHTFGGGNSLLLGLICLGQRFQSPQLLQELGERENLAAPLLCQCSQISRLLLPLLHANKDIIMSCKRTNLHTIHVNFTIPITTFCFPLPHSLSPFHIICWTLSLLLSSPALYICWTYRRSKHHGSSRRELGVVTIVDTVWRKLGEATRACTTGGGTWTGCGRGIEL